MGLQYLIPAQSPVFLASYFNRNWHFKMLAGWDDRLVHLLQALEGDWGGGALPQEAGGLGWPSSSLSLSPGCYGEKGGRRRRRVGLLQKKQIFSFRMTC